MRVIINDSVFADSDASADLLELFLLSRRGRHNLLIAAGKTTMFTHWVANRGLEEQELIDMVLRTSLDRESKNAATLAVRIIGSKESAEPIENEPSLNIAKALPLLREPFRVIVEDQVGERAFILAASSPENRRWLMRAESEGWLRFEHGGGDAMGRLFKLTSPDGLVSREARLRVFLLRDSDGLHPGDRSLACQAFIKQCQDFGIEVAKQLHILSRRFIESYLPYEAIAQWWLKDTRGVPNKLAITEAWSRLSREQRDHYNMKKGWKGDQPRLIAQENGIECIDHQGLRIPKLYENLTKDAIDHLGNGFGKRIADHYTEEAHWYVTNSAWRHREEIATELDFILGLILGAL